MALATEGDLAGHWEGAVDVAGQKLVMTVDVKSNAGQLEGSVVFPQQTQTPFSLEKVSAEGGKVHFEALPAPRTAVFDGAFEGPDKVTGKFSQAGFESTFTIERKQAAAAPTAEALPYQAEEVKFKSGDVTLAGTLTLPEGPGPHPAVVLISGSGPENRDEEIFGFKIFRLIADALTRKGIAVLRYDDRGVGGSSAGTADDTSETFAKDVASAVDYLKTRPDIDPKQIGLFGHSEGGAIAPMVATQASAVQKSDMAFLVLMAPPGVSGRDVILEQVKLIAKANGATDAEVEQLGQEEAVALDAVMTGNGLDAVRADLRKQTEDLWNQMTDEQHKALGDKDQWVNNAVEQQLAALQSPWIKFFLAYDPAPTLQKVKAPVLALFGGKDVQVAAASNSAGLEAALKAGGNPDVTVKTFPDANHLFQAAATGSPNEYAVLPKEFVPGFLDTISEWILAHVKLPAQ
jgi:uncharacterized protein